MHPPSKKLSDKKVKNTITNRCVSESMSVGLCGWTSRSHTPSAFFLSRAGFWRLNSPGGSFEDYEEGTMSNRRSRGTRRVGGRPALGASLRRGSRAARCPASGPAAAGPGAGRLAGRRCLAAVHRIHVRRVRSAMEAAPAPPAQSAGAAAAEPLLPAPAVVPATGAPAPLATASAPAPSPASASHGHWCWPRTCCPPPPPPATCPRCPPPAPPRPASTRPGAEDPDGGRHRHPDLPKTPPPAGRRSSSGGRCATACSPYRPAGRPPAGGPGAVGGGGGAGGEPGPGDGADWLRAGDGDGVPPGPGPRHPVAVGPEEQTRPRR